MGAVGRARDDLRAGRPWRVRDRSAVLADGDVWEPPTSRWRWVRRTALVAFLVVGVVDFLAVWVVGLVTAVRWVWG